MLLYANTHGVIVIVVVIDPLYNLRQWALPVRGCKATSLLDSLLQLLILGLAAMEILRAQSVHG
jgi:hypothetical protein